MSDKPNTTTLPDGWRLFDKYQIRHTDGTPLKGKRYFVLRLDTDDPAEAARVAAAMSAYKGAAPGKTVELHTLIEDLLYMAKRYVKKTPATVTVISDSDTHETQKTIDYYETIKKAEAALLAPARNCERFNTWDEARTAYYCEVPNGVQPIGEWLFTKGKVAK